MTSDSLGSSSSAFSGSGGMLSRINSDGCLSGIDSIDYGGGGSGYTDCGSQTTADDDLLSVYSGVSERSFGGGLSLVDNNNNNNNDLAELSLREEGDQY